MSISFTCVVKRHTPTKTTVSRTLMCVCTCVCEYMSTRTCVYEYVCTCVYVSTSELCMCVCVFVRVCVGMGKYGVYRHSYPLSITRLYRRFYSDDIHAQISYVFRSRKERYLNYLVLFF